MTIVSTDITAIKSYLCQLQARLCATFEKIDGSKKFNEDIWQRSDGGGGITRVLENGDVLEKAGVNFSHVFGDRLPPAASARRTDLQDRSFQALGVSLVFHPRNPYAPTTHLNVRFFIAEKEDAAPLWWFGGGFDLTPYYGFVEDAEHWHRCAQQACLPFGQDVYPQFKKNCDDYFYLKHRQEARGIGGIFFDDINQWDFATCFSLLRSVGDHFILAYEPILQRRKDIPYTAQQKSFQEMRRGRYVEFNLVYDRGTLFGLQSGGRTESILISLPPAVHWHYDWHAEPDSPEARLLSEFLQPRDWLSIAEQDSLTC